MVSLGGMGSVDVVVVNEVVVGGRKMFDMATQTTISWTPGGLQVDSRWILDKELAGLTPIKKRSKVHLECTWSAHGICGLG
jgi:hypothetical protein